MALSKEDIFAIADKLESEGTSPTQNLVREALGGGSFATIGPALKEWKDMQRAENALVEVKVPELINDRMEQLKAAVWQTAIEEADRRLSVDRQALQEAQAEAQSAIAEADEAVKILESEAEERVAKIDKIESETEILNKRILDVERSKASVERDYAADVARMEEKIEGLEARLADAQAAKAEARADAEQGRKDAKEAVSRVEEELQRAIKVAETASASLKKYEAYFEPQDGKA